MARSIEHNIFPDLSPRAEIVEKMALLEKAWLEHDPPGYPGRLDALMENFIFFHIQGAPVRYDTRNSRFHPAFIMPDLLAAMHNQLLPLIHIIRCHNRRVDVWSGSSRQGAPVLEGLLESSPGPSLYSPVIQAGQMPEFESFQWCATVTGIPTDPVMKNRINRAQDSEVPGIDNLISGLLNENWVYLVQAFPVQRLQVAAWLETCAREIKDIKEAFLLRDIQKANRMASYYADMLEKSIKRLMLGKQQGYWQTGIYIFSDSEETARKGAALLVSVLSSDRSRPEPLRSHVCLRESAVSPFINGYNSSELHCFTALPRREYPGFRLKEQIDFDVDFAPATDRSLDLGEIIGSSPSGQACSIPVDDLTRHTLVAGVTGSGKTNTVFNILGQAYNSFNVPFLVIEPAKSEYRCLMEEMKQLLVFTLGEERPMASAPFRLNPFVFPRGISLQTHIDFLKAVFHASFVMYAPMPYVLEECLYKIYQDKGWNLVTSTNYRGSGPLSFPTLSDLYYKIDEVVTGLGYQDRTIMDIKAALQTRIRNLCLGAKGMMLDTSASIPFEQIMERPVIMELKYLGNDEEKAFMMGLILMSIYEHYESEQHSGVGQGNGLRHLTVIEEAHRLLKNVPTEKSSEEQTNVKGMGVETFCNLLAEIRAYGEGVVVSEQIPAKLAPDVIKNSNMKIMHRLVAREDRELMGDTMNLDQNQQRGILGLETGEAVFFREGLDRPVRIRAGLAAARAETVAISNSDIAANMAARFYSHNKGLLAKFAACFSCDYQGDDCEMIKQQVEELVSAEDWEDMAVKFFLPFMFDPGMSGARAHLASLLHLQDRLYYCLVSHLVQDYIRFKGGYNGWNFDEAQNLAERAQAAIKGDGFVAEIALFCQSHRCDAPYALCKDYCLCDSSICYEGSVLARNPLLHNRLIDVLDTSEYGTRFCLELASMLGEHVRDFVPPALSHSLGGIILCYLVHKLNELKFSLPFQRRIVNEFAKMAGSLI